MNAPTRRQFYFSKGGNFLYTCWAASEDDLRCQANKVRRQVKIPLGQLTIVP